MMAKTKELDKKQEKKIGLFDFISSISENKKYLLNDDTATEYVPYMVQKALMQHIDTIMLANEVNKCSSISKEMHHDFLFYSVDAKLRYGKWAKKEEENAEVLDYLKSTYNVNQEVALMYLNTLDNEGLDIIKTKMKNKGGKR